MMSQIPRSRKHHFVPQAQLRHFAADANRKSLFVFNKQTDRSYRTSILNAGSENDFNTVSVGEMLWNFEDLFDQVDRRSARLVNLVNERQSLGWMTVDDRVALADLFAVQHLRTRFSRTTPLKIAEQLREAVREIGFDPDTAPDIVLPSEPSLRLGAVKAYLNREGHLAAFARLTPALYNPLGASRFITSDHPVTLANAFPYGEASVGAHGILAHLPLSPTLTLTLICPTVVERYELAGEAPIGPERRERILAFRDGFRSGEPIKVDDEFVGRLNEYQIVQSARYLYGAADDFDFARSLLAARPGLRTVESHLTIGAMGRGPPRRPQMPAGRRLVVFGALDHGMLEVEVIDDGGEGITARTPNIELLAQMAADSGMLRVELYQDGQALRQIGQAMIERLDDLGEGWFRVVHRDPSLRALVKQLDQQQSAPR